MERSFKTEVEALKLGDGDTFHGEGILAVTKALLQSGVSYVGGYQGSPISHLIDVLVDAKPLMDQLGVHLETSTSEAAAGAMLAASINYPIRGAVTWKSPVGTNVASDGLSNISSSGVVGGAMIILGEDYGEGASVIQERSHAFAMKSSMWLLDPRPNLTSIVDMVEKGFELSEASNSIVMMQLRIRTCHVYGRFAAKDNREGQYSRNRPLQKPEFSMMRLPQPGFTGPQERLKIDHRLPAALKYIVDNKLNEVFPGDLADIGIIMQGGLYNTVLRVLQRIGLADTFGNSRIPIYCMNVTYPQVPEEITKFCAGKRAVLMMEEGHPDYIEQALNTYLRRADINTKIYGKDVLPMGGEYTADVVMKGLVAFLDKTRPSGLDATDRGRKGAGRTHCRLQGFCRRHGRHVDPRPQPDILHRLSGASDVLGAEACRARGRPDACFRRHRLSQLRHVRAVPPRQYLRRLRPRPRELDRHCRQLRQARRLDHGRWWLLA